MKSASATNSSESATGKRESVNMLTDQAMRVAIGPTMTSREMADLTEKRHDSVKRNIDTIAEKGIISQPQIVGGGKSLNGVLEKLYCFAKRDSYIIVAQLSPEFTARLVDRWQELEACTPAPMELSRLQLLELAMQSEKERITLAAKVAADAPAVAFVDRYVVATGLTGFRQLCKLLEVKENKFRDFLLDCNIWYRLGGTWVPHAQHIDAGRCALRAGVSTATEHAFNSAKFTPKGVTWITGEWAKHQLAIRQKGRVAPCDAVKESTIIKQSSNVVLEENTVGTTMKAGYAIEYGGTVKIAMQIGGAQ